ncbi:MAG: hypothetical protein HYY01_02825 [Chloroflexi bacterium]|nr:hypothetical protein [Chloroflexota bacterium]
MNDNGNKQGNWPIYYKTQLSVGNLESNVGVCTLWTEQPVITKELDKADYAVCGNLYSVWGINYLVRNILANPNIRYIVLCGADKSESGQALVDLFRNGVDDSSGLVGSKLRIDKAIPREVLTELVNSVTLVDLRGVTEAKAIRHRIKHLKPLPPFADSRVFPESAPSVIALPSEKSGFRVTGDTVAEVWLKVLKLVMQFGDVKPSEYTMDQKELLNVLAVIHSENPDEPYFPEWLPLTRTDLESYYPQVLSAEIVSTAGKGLQLMFWNEGYFERTNELTHLKYTYGGRFKNYRGVGLDQIESLIQLLQKRSYTRRAVAVTWDPFVDPESEHPPCLMSLLASVQRGELYLTAHFRSHDIYGAWCHNAFALRKLQHQIAQRVGVRIGSLTVISQSAHIYSDRWLAVQELVEKYYPREAEWKDDARGNFHIYIDGSTIVAEHATTLHGKTGLRFEGTTARGVYLAITNSDLVSLPEHMAYLGYELGKAELAIKLGVDYVQDRALDLAASGETLSCCPTVEP